jgi:hypothetical protein
LIGELPANQILMSSSHTIGMAGSMPALRAPFLSKIRPLLKFATQTAQFLPHYQRGTAAPSARHRRTISTAPPHHEHGTAAPSAPQHPHPSTAARQHRSTTSPALVQSVGYAPAVLPDDGD